MVPRLLRRIRWWWWIGILWIAGWVAIVGPLTSGSSIRRAMVGPSALARLAVLGPLLCGIAWLVVIAPRLEARAAGFSERAPARRRSRICRVFAWGPTVILTLLLIQFVVVRALGRDDFGWFDHGYGWWVLGAVVLSVFYGRMASRHLDQRVRAAAASEGVCYACNYPLTGLTGERCPECGWKMSQGE